MKKLAIFIASLVILLVTVSAFVDKRNEAVLGEKAPNLVLNNDNGDAVSLESLKGKWVILSFWSSADADSRLSQNQVASYLRQFQSERNSAIDVEVVSVNFDRSQKLMDEIIRRDGLNDSLQFFIGDADWEVAVRRAYSMREGLRTFVINPIGELVAADPEINDLRSIIG